MKARRRIQWAGWPEPECLAEFEEDSKEGEADGLREWK